MEKQAIRQEVVRSTVNNILYEIDKDLKDINLVSIWDILKIYKEINDFLVLYNRENKYFKGQIYDPSIVDKMSGYRQLLKNKFSEKFKDKEYQNPKVEKEVIDKLKEYGLKIRDISELTGISEISIKRLSGGTKEVINKEKGKPVVEKSIYLFDNIGKDEIEKKELIKVYQNKFRELYNENDKAAESVEIFFDKHGPELADKINAKKTMSEKYGLIRGIMQKIFNHYIKNFSKNDQTTGGDINIENKADLRSIEETEEENPFEKEVREKKENIYDKYSNFIGIKDLNNLSKTAEIK